MQEVEPRHRLVGALMSYNQEATEGKGRALQGEARICCAATTNPRPPHCFKRALARARVHVRGDAASVVGHRHPPAAQIQVDLDAARVPALHLRRGEAGPQG